MKENIALFDSSKDPNTLRIIPMGGVGEFGMNMTAYLYRGRLLVVDCGVRFPDTFKLGINGVIPEVGPFFAQAGGVFAYVMTHGHEDHIGALPYILPRWPAPLYGTAWTLELIRARMRRMNIDPDGFELHEVAGGDRIKSADFEVELVPVNHSIPMTCSIVIRTPSTTVFHTGDFKLDPNPLLENPFSPETLKAIGDTGVDLLVADSTNAEKAGRCPSESTVTEPLADVFRAAPQAIICSTFASNLWRLKSIADACIATDRRLFVTGAGLEQTITIGKALNLYHLPENLLLAESQLATFPRNRLVVLATGCQGEWRSALARISASEHKAFSARPGDTLVLSARMIPGNEKPVLNLCNAFLKLGVSIITPKEAPGIHVSGHAYQEDLRLLCSLVKPRRFLPVHGAFSQLLANYRMASGQLTEANASLLIQSGDVIDLTADSLSHVGTLNIPLEYVDSDAGVPLTHETLRERLKIGELGAAIVTGFYNAPERRWMMAPKIDLIGLAFPDEIHQENWLSTEATKLAALVTSNLLGKLLPVQDVMEEVRIYLRRRLHQVLKKKPVVLVKIHFV